MRQQDTLLLGKGRRKSERIGTDTCEGRKQRDGICVKHYVLCGMYIILEQKNKAAVVATFNIGLFYPIVAFEPEFVRKFDYVLLLIGANHPYCYCDHV